MIHEEDGLRNPSPFRHCVARVAVAFARQSGSRSKRARARCVEAQTRGAGWRDHAEAGAGLWTRRDEPTVCRGMGGRIRYRAFIGCRAFKASQRANDWLSYIAACLLSDDVRVRHAKRPLRIVDGSVIRSSGKGGTGWRLHATYDPAEGRFSKLEISDTHGGESLSRHKFENGDLVLGDRGYARTPGLLHVREMGADFLIRIGWCSLIIRTASEKRLARRRSARV